MTAVVASGSDTATAATFLEVDATMTADVSAVLFVAAFSGQDPSPALFDVTRDGVSVDPSGAWEEVTVGAGIRNRHWFWWRLNPLALPAGSPSDPVVASITVPGGGGEQGSLAIGWLTVSDAGSLSALSEPQVLVSPGVPDAGFGVALAAATNTTLAPLTTMAADSGTAVFQTAGGGTASPSHFVGVAAYELAADADMDVGWSPLLALYGSMWGSVGASFEARKFTGQIGKV